MTAMKTKKIGNQAIQNTRQNDMLIDLRVNILKALVSYVKEVEKSQDHLILDGDINDLINSTTKLKGHRKQDLLAIDQICQTAIDEHWQKGDLLVSISNYLDQMQTGFWIFPGNSKLREKILYAIELYDIRHIRNEDGKITIVTDISYIKVNDELKPSSEYNPLYSDSRVEQMQTQIAELSNEVAAQKQLINQQNEERKEMFEVMKTLQAQMTEVIRETRSQVSSLKNELSAERIKNIELREASLREMGDEKTSAFNCELDDELKAQNTENHDLGFRRVVNY